MTAQISIFRGSPAEALDGRAREEVRLAGRRAHPEDRRELRAAEFVVELELLACHVEEPAQVDVVRAGAQRSPHHLEVEAVVGAVDADGRSVEGARDGIRVARVDELVAFQAEIARPVIGPPLFEEGADFPPDRSRSSDDRDHAATPFLAERACLALTASQSSMRSSGRRVAAGLLAQPVHR